MANPFKYRADHAGSLVLPTRLAEARAAHAAGDIDADRLTSVENDCIDEALKKQAASGIDVRSDGEFRRHDFVAELNDSSGDLQKLIEAVERQGKIALGDALYLHKAANGRAYKVGLVGPGHVVGRLLCSGADDAVEAATAAASALAPLVREQIRALVAAGVPYVQLTNRYYGHLLATSNHAALQASGRDAVAILRAVIAADTAALEDAGRGEGTAVGQQLCAGAAEPWQRSAGYEPLAEELFGRLPVDRFNLQVPADVTSADFGPLRLIPGSKVVSLGLIRSDREELEDADWVLDRLDEADAVFAMENLAVSVQDGFGKLSGDALDRQYRKLHLAGIVARRYWGFEM